MLSWGVPAALRDTMQEGGQEAGGLAGAVDTEAWRLRGAGLGDGSQPPLNQRLGKLNQLVGGFKTVT